MSCGNFERQVVVVLVMFLWTRLFSGVAFALDPKKTITQYVHDVWTTEDGLPQNSILAITQTRDGYLWLGTWEGLVRFDGVRFTVFNRGNTKEIKNNFIFALREDRQGNLWVGTSGGLNRFRDGQFTTYTTKDGLTSDNILSIHEDRQGNLWIGTAHSGLNRFRDGKFTPFTRKEGLAADVVYAIHEDRKGNLWVGTSGGLNRFRDGQFTTYTTRDGLSSDHIMSIYEDRQGNLWIGTANSGLNRFRDGKFVHYTTKEGLSHNWVYSIFEDREGGLWIGTNGGGLNRFENGKFTRFTTSDGLSHDTVYSLHEDREGSLWIGTWGGLNRFRDGKFTVFTTKEGLSSDWVQCIYEDREGTLWMGTYGGGLNWLKNGKFFHYAIKKGTAHHVWGIYGDREGGIWFSTESHGLYRFKGGSVRRYGTKEGLSWDYVVPIYEDHEGSLWVGTYGRGLNRYKDGKFTQYTTKDGLSDDRIGTIYEHPRGNLWIATEGGLNRFKNGRFYTAKDGLSHVTSLYADREGTLWITTRGDGLTRLKDGKFTTYTTKDGLFDNALTTVLEDGKGILWIGSFKGIFRVDKKELDEVAQGKTRLVESIAYGKADGMKSVECNGRPPSGWKSKDGRLWFPTIKGLVAVDPDNMKLNTLPPPVFIEQVILDKKPIGVGQTAELSPGNRELEFHYTALSFLDPKKVRFKYKLEGYDEEWVDAGTRRVAYYTRLSPGSYRFRVIACNNDGVWNETGTELELNLRPHFYETRWFYALCAVFTAIALILAGVGVYHLRVQRLRGREKELTLLVNERTKDLQETKRELEDMNQNLEHRVQRGIKTLAEAERMAAYGKLVANVAHEVRKPLFALRTAAYVIEETIIGPKEVRVQLDVVQQTTERLTSLMDDLLEFARPKPLQLEPTDIEELLKEAVTTYQVEHDSRFPKIDLVFSGVSEDGLKPLLPQIVADRSRMVQVLVNLIENAAKHAKGLSTVTFSAELNQNLPSRICIRVANDGAGIDPKNLPQIFDPFFTTGKGTGLGLAIVQQIVKGHDGTITVESQPGSGTIFTIDLPVKTSGATPRDA